MHTAKKPARNTAERHLSLVGEQPGSKYQVLFDQATDAILTATHDGQIDAANLAMENLTGYLKSELTDAQVSILVPDENRMRLHHRMRPLTPSLFSTPGTHEDIAILRKDGYIRLVDLNVRILSEGTDGREPYALALFRDVTEKKAMERELITKHTELRNAYFQLEKNNAELKAMQDTLVQAGKMAALGELAAGIAHELNQPLQGIRGYAQELQGILQSGAEDVRSSLAEIISNSDKMAAIIGHLRSFTRKSVEKHEFTNIHLAVDESLKMLSRQFAARGITVQRKFGENVPQIYANPLQLEQVFINLATNARDAIEATGRGRGTISIHTKRSGNFIEVLYRDDGCGMTERTKTKAFNPFFTTKDVGRGMGLGLSLSYGILTKLHGSIVVESELGKGAAFVIRIPVDFRELA
ncbi:MAG: hypothetical protein A2X94_05825 [Bdellovibrionales bacterium GWB1_55_8]|nr:MAG: hypothetical protein A2X94_05825 [Bdellovibrionales bacterium GWB1_55_8]